MPKQESKLWRPLPAIRPKGTAGGSFDTAAHGTEKELKRHLRKEDFQSAEATRARIAELTTELKTCRRDIVLCSDIADRSEQVRKNLEQIEQQKIERKEKTENELLVRRSSRAGREDDAQRR